MTILRVSLSSEPPPLGFPFRQGWGWVFRLNLPNSSVKLYKQYAPMAYAIEKCIR